MKISVPILIFIIFSLFSTTFVYAELLNTDILKKIYSITGAAVEVTPTEATTTTSETTTTTTEAAPTTVTTAPEETVIKIPVETTEEPTSEVTPEVKSTEAPFIEVPIVICPTVLPPKPECPSDAFPAEQFSDKGCLIGYQCTSMIKPPEVRPGEGGEVGVPGIQCPESRTCLDGSTPPCRIENNNCVCDPCLIQEEKIPEGCRQEGEKGTGFVKLVCEEFRKCPPDEQQARHKQECEQQGGNPVPFQDPSGCTFYDCKFGDRQNEEAAPNPLYGYDRCPPPEEIDMSIKKCNSMELFGAVSFEGGCRVVKCLKEEEKCKMLTPEMRLRVEGECDKRGMKAMKDFDEKGCQFFKCVEGNFCERDPPKEAFDGCRMKGGEMIVKRDERGCVSYTNCIERGDERELYVEPMERIPEPTELLSIAFKLEQLKIELDKLARQASDIADYYASVDNSDEHRFRRAASMFDSVKDKIDEIKDDLRSRLETLTPEDMEQIRFDIKSVKESLKDIVYIMLSNSDDVKEMIEVESARKKPTRPGTPLEEEIATEGTNCGTNGMCFDKAIRVCKPVAFLPEGRAGPIVTITGLEKDACILHVELPEGQGPPGFKGKIYMDCQIQKYSLGVRGPEDILPYCKGPMKEMIEKYGTGPGAPGGPSRQQFGGPGGCTSDTECNAYCEKNPEECLKWCRENPGMCPPEAELHIKQTTEGRIAIEFCDPEGEMEFKECANRGGRPQSDTTSGGCEIFTHCIVPEIGAGKCDCTWAAGTREHPMGCPVLCSDYSYGKAACDAQSKNGCAWFGGSVEPVETVGRAVQACVGCLNNGICDVGECSECADCLRR